MSERLNDVQCQPMTAGSMLDCAALQKLGEKGAPSDFNLFCAVLLRRKRAQDFHTASYGYMAVHASFQEYLIVVEYQRIIVARVLMAPTLLHKVGEKRAHPFFACATY